MIKSKLVDGYCCATRQGTEYIVVGNHLVRSVNDHLNSIPLSCYDDDLCIINHDGATIHIDDISRVYRKDAKGSTMIWDRGLVTYFTWVMKGIK